MLCYTEQQVGLVWTFQKIIRREDVSLLCRCTLPRCPDRPGGAAGGVAETVAEPPEEVDDRLDPRQQHEDRAEHAAGHRHDRHGLHDRGVSS